MTYAQALVLCAFCATFSCFQLSLGVPDVGHRVHTMGEEMAHGHVRQPAAITESLVAPRGPGSKRLGEATEGGAASQAKVAAEEWLSLQGHHSTSEAKAAFMAGFHAGQSLQNCVTEPTAAPIAEPTGAPTAAPTAASTPTAKRAQQEWQHGLPACKCSNGNGEPQNEEGNACRPIAPISDNEADDWVVGEVQKQGYGWARNKREPALTRCFCAGGSYSDLGQDPGCLARELARILQGIFDGVNMASYVICPLSSVRNIGKEGKCCDFSVGQTATQCNYPGKMGLDNTVTPNPLVMPKCVAFQRKIGCTVRPHGANGKVDPKLVWEEMCDAQMRETSQKLKVSYYKAGCPGGCNRPELGEAWGGDKRSANGKIVTRRRRGSLTGSLSLATGKKMHACNHFEKGTSCLKSDANCVWCKGNHKDIASIGMAGWKCRKADEGGAISKCSYPTTKVEDLTKSVKGDNFNEHGNVVTRRRRGSLSGSVENGLLPQIMKFVGEDADGKIRYWWGKALPLFMKGNIAGAIKAGAKDQKGREGLSNMVQNVRRTFMSKQNPCTFECMCKGYFDTFLDNRFKFTAKFQCDATAKFTWQLKKSKFEWAKMKITGKEKIKIGSHIIVDKISVRDQSVEKYSLKYGAAVCTMTVDLALPVCKGCCCSQGLAGTIINTALTRTSPDGAQLEEDVFQCKPWFTVLDALVRSTINLFRSVKSVGVFQNKFGCY